MGFMADRGVVEKFTALEKELGERHPDARREALDLADRIADPRTANADAIWAHTWNKPLFANTKVSIAIAAVSRLEPYMSGAWRDWGGEVENFRISKISKGSGTEAFECSTQQAREIRLKTGIAMHRLFAIQGAAVALRNRASRQRAPYADLVDADLRDVVPKVRDEMGPGWGHITVLHFLTDLGLACKPDLHLVRTIHHLGMAMNLRNSGVPNIADALTINHRVRSLIEAIDGSFSPARLRYVDKTLMDISKLGLI